MMNKIDVERMVDKKLAKMKKQMMEELQRQINDNPKTIWDLDIDDREEYCLLNSNGHISNEIFNSPYDEIARDIGNAFLTLEEAEFELERRKVETVMRKYSRPFKSGEDNWIVEYHHDDECIDIDFIRMYDRGIHYFESEEIAEKVIDEIGEDRLKKYWFGVEDDE